MNVVYAYTPWFTDTGDDGRAIVGIVIHDTETHSKVDPRQEGSWHYEIDRDGTVYQFVDERDIAWHVRAADRYWPEWLPDWGDYPVSVVNEWTIGIELVSDAQYRSSGVPYTEAQYQALVELVHAIEDRYGYLPLVGHGELQADRSDPVDFDWQWFRNALEAPEVSDEERQQLQAKIDELVSTNSALDDQVMALREEVAALHATVDALQASEGGIVRITHSPNVTVEVEQS